MPGIFSTGLRSVDPTIEMKTTFAEKRIKVIEAAHESSVEKVPKRVKESK